MRETGFIDDTEMLTLINDVYPELYDELVGAYENYYSTTSTVSISPGTSSYALPADLYKILAVEYQVSVNGAYVTLYPFMEGERNQEIVSNTSIPSGTVRIRYVPAPTTFTSLSQTVDGISGWDRLLSLLVAIDMLDAEESDSAPLTRKYARVLERIRSMSPTRDAANPARVVDVSTARYNPIYSNLRYRLQGNNIEFINAEYMGTFD
jgi:hypothetical protein